MLCACSMWGTAHWLQRTCMYLQYMHSCRWPHRSIMLYCQESVCCIWYLVPQTCLPYFFSFQRLFCNEMPSCPICLDQPRVGELSAIAACCARKASLLAIGTVDPTKVGACQSVLVCALMPMQPRSLTVDTSSAGAACCTTWLW